MASSESPRPRTPPSHPISGVHMSLAHIEQLIVLGFPNLHLISAIQLPTGRSFNNRIYFLRVRPKESDEEQDLVLKVNGRFFGADKIQNEVACLSLLERYCPGIPVPRLLAWSETGRDVTVLPATNRESRTGRILPKTDSAKGWILMTRVPGEPMTTLDLDGDSMVSLVVQLADFVAEWRNSVPVQSHCGNIRFCTGEYADAPVDIRIEGSNDAYSSSKLVVRGFLQGEIKIIEAMSSTNDFQRSNLENRIKVLETVDTYGRSRDMANPLRNFLAHSLPRLKFNRLGNNESFVLTHYDLSPRNVLVSGRPLRITGLVDFEFAGFFPHFQEFLNDSANNDGDWSEKVYRAYLDRLEERGVATPAKGFDKTQWEHALWLEKMKENIAPWWLPGDFTGSNLDDQFQQSETLVRETLKKLSAAAER